MFIAPEENIKHLSIKPADIVADIGAGGGFYAVALAQLVNPQGKVYAIEVQQDLLDRVMHLAADRQLDNVDVVWGDVEHIGGTRLRDQSVDVVVVVNVLFQVKHRQSAMREILRILKPGGQLLIIDWDKNHQSLGPNQDSLFTKEMAKTLLAGQSVTVLKEFDAGDNHYGLIFVKKSQD